MTRHGVDRFAEWVSIPQVKGTLPYGVVRGKLKARSAGGSLPHPSSYPLTGRTQMLRNRTGLP